VLTLGPLDGCGKSLMFSVAAFIDAAAVVALVLLLWMLLRRRR
jgi:hypothetical protein